MLSDSLREYIAACFTGLWVQSHEHDDALLVIAELCRQENWKLATWDVDEASPSWASFTSFTTSALALLPAFMAAFLSGELQESDTAVMSLFNII